MLPFAQFLCSVDDTFLEYVKREKDFGVMAIGDIGPRSVSDRDP